jgi:adenylate kinase family enzyme
MKRIVVIGSGGAGKSTLARQIGEVLGIEVFHLDALHWKPGWAETPKDEWKVVVEDLVKGDSWIIDGNYGGTIEIRLDAADTVVFMDFPRGICLWQAVKRVLQYRGKTRPDMGPECPERIEWEFAKWIWRFPTDSRPTILKRIEEHCAGKRVITLRSRRDVKAFLNDLQHEAKSNGGK